jgi:protein PsiE
MIESDTTLKPGASAGDEPQGPVTTFFHVGMEAIEKLFLIAVAALTVYAAYLDLQDLFATPLTGEPAARVDLAVVLQFFLYAEVIAMVAVFFTRTGQLFTFPLLIAMTALARFMVIESKEFPPEGFVYLAGAILLLSIAVAILSRFTRE